MAAYALQRSNHWLGQYYRRIKSRSGPLVATKATARKLAIIFYEMVNNRVEFSPILVENYNQKFKEQRIKMLKKHALSLGLQLQEIKTVS